MGLKEGLKRFVNEVAETLEQKFHQGRDELGKALFHDNAAYMPWREPERQTVHEQAQHAVDVGKAMGDIRMNDVEGYQASVRQEAQHTIDVRTAIQEIESGYNPADYARSQPPDQGKERSR